ncbi:M23 family metallopeptidase [Hydrogenophaga atypica]|uniref:M23 family metallopeptidase n=1 Tax=Hydrogenophaga atypica TaxID=249409 RepID=A0ABW2QDW9_9BURK
MGSLGALLLGTGVTAFGVAPLAPDAADLPVRSVSEAIEPALRLVQGGGEATVPFVLFRSDVTRRDDNAQSLLQRLGVSDSAAVAFLRNDPVARGLFSGRTGKLVTVETTDRNEIIRLSARWLSKPDDRQFQRLTLERQNDGFLAKHETADLTASAQLASGTIQSSLFAATDAVRLPDSVASQLADIFSSDIDFRRDLRKGDRFSIVYESLEADGEVLRAGRILSAEFVNDGKQLQTLWFQEPGHKGGYYGFDGKSQRSTYLTSPLEFSRVSSGYGMRFHPIHGGQRAHLGVDFAAPTGTPVRTVGDGVVQFAGWQGGYGNIVVVQHANNQTTAYAHLSRIDVRKGQKIEQGEFIGAVGSTGASTGPHLHFEFRDKGKHIDPLTIARNGESIPVSAAARAQFDQVVHTMRAQLASAATLTQASAQ